jgi:CHASE3 domain sensor protein
MVAGKKSVIGFSSALFFLVLIGLLQYRSMRHVVRNNARVSHAELVMSELDATLAASLEADRDCAFYIFTGYLQSYLEALPHAEQHLHNLEVLTAGDQDRRTRFEVLKPLVARNLQRLNDLVELRQWSGADAARAALQNEEGTRLTEDIRNTVRQMESEERALLRHGSMAAEAGIRRTAWLSSLAIILALGILLLSGWVIHLDISARKQLEQERDRFWTLSNDLILVYGVDRVCAGREGRGLRGCMDTARRRSRVNRCLC